MRLYPRTVAGIAAASLLAAFAAQANKGAEYQAPHHHKHHHKNFFITGGATYLEPSVNGLDYVGIVQPDLGTVSTYSVQPEFNWGYFLQAGYRISHHYDLQGSWAQYNSSMSNSASVVGFGDGTTGLTSSNGEPGPVAPGATATAHSSQNIEYSYADANLGQYHDITEMLKARLFAGVSYAKVDSSTNNTYTTDGAAAADAYRSKFNGVGPEIGLDLEYKIWHTFGVVGHFATAFLVGNQEASSNVYNLADGQMAVSSEDTTRLIPTLNTKLGVNWNIPYEYDRFSFGLEAGYQVAYYWDVVDQVQYSSTDAPQHNYSNYGNMGPYLNLTAMF
jgi:hypothetical protein